jgi:creatinine amidohydrolase
MAIPLEFFKRVAERAGGVVLPPLFLGPDGVLEHDGKMYYGMDFYSFEDGYPQHLIGNMHYIPEPLFIQIIEHIMKNLKRSGFAALVSFGHGPSMDALLKNRERLENEFEMKIFSLTDFCGNMPGDHAAFYETAMFMALCPDSADFALLPDDKPPISVWGREPRVAAIKEEGERLVALYEEQTVAKLIEINEILPKPDLTLEYNHVKDLRY